MKTRIDNAIDRALFEEDDEQFDGSLLVGIAAICLLVVVATGAFFTWYAN